MYYALITCNFEREQKKEEEEEREEKRREEKRRERREREREGKVTLLKNEKNDSED